MKISHLNTFINYTVSSGIGKIYVCVFLLCISFFSAQLHISEGAIVHIENSKDFYVSNSENRTSEIYIASGAEIVNLDDAKYKIVSVSTSEKKSPKKLLAKSEAEEKILEKKEIKKAPAEAPVKNNFAFSTESGSDISSTNTTKTVFTLVSGSASSKIIAAFPKNNFSLNQISRKPSNTFLYSDCTISNHHLASFSVRPPPFFL